MTYDALLGAFYTDERFEFLREDGSPMPLAAFEARLRQTPAS
ncbi:hypothetical protein ACO2Q2_16675 [Dyella sp. KRB-257]